MHCVYHQNVDARSDHSGVSKELHTATDNGISGDMPHRACLCGIFIYSTTAPGRVAVEAAKTDYSPRTAKYATYTGWGIP